MFSRIWTHKSMQTCSGDIARLKEALDTADAVVIGAGAGLSTSAGLTYSGPRFARYFSDFQQKYGITDIYSGGFYPYQSLEEYWAWWSRHIYVNRYMDAPKPVYQDLLALVQDKDYFVLTTNVDHQFQKAGFVKKQLFYTQGDYGLWQCSQPCHPKTYDNGDMVRQMVETQGYVIAEDGTLTLPAGVTPKMAVPSALVPYCPKCGRPMTMNLRSDDSFVEDDGWHKAADCYAAFLRRHEGLKLLFLELGVGSNTPVIIKYPFWRMTERNENAIYACVNDGEATAPRALAKRSICIDADIGSVLQQLG